MVEPHTLDRRAHAIARPADAGAHARLASGKDLKVLDRFAPEGQARIGHQPHRGCQRLIGLKSSDDCHIVTLGKMPAAQIAAFCSLL